MTATGYVSTTGDTRKVNKAGDTMTGELTLPDSSPDQALNAASKGYVDTVAATKAALAHAAQHAAAGSDPVTLTQAQITGLVSALAALLPLTGGTVTGGLTVQGYTTLAGGQANNWSSFGVLRALAGDASVVHDLDATTGVATLGAKNGLAGLRICGKRASTGAPSTGTWTAGDVVLDSAGAWWLCTADGTPGTWQTYLLGTAAGGDSLLDLPSEQNLLAWTYDPNMAGHVTAQSNAGVAGRVSLSRIIIRKTITWSNIWIGLSGVDAGASLSNCYLGVYDSSGNLKGTTADISSSLMTGATAKALALTSSFSAAPGTYYIAMLLNGTWATNSLTFKCSGAGVSVNAGLSAPNLKYSSVLTGQTSLPSSITLANQSTTIITTGWDSQWYGVS